MWTANLIAWLRRFYAGEYQGLSDAAVTTDLVSSGLTLVAEDTDHRLIFITAKDNPSSGSRRFKFFAFKKTDFPIRNFNLLLDTAGAFFLLVREGVILARASSTGINASNYIAVWKQ